MTCRLLLAILLLVPMFGCGYHLANRSNNLPGEVDTLYVELFENQTYEPYLENRLTDLVLQEFARHGVLRPVAEKEADTVLSAVIKTYTTKPISYDREDEIAEYRIHLKLLATLRKSDSGKVLWKGELDWTEEYPASEDKSAQEDNEAAAFGVIAGRLAEELHFRVVENF